MPEYILRAGNDLHMTSSIPELWNVSGKRTQALSPLYLGAGSPGMT
jgi:hypothetical protein